MDSYKIDKVYRTTNYAKFKRLIGNRSVTNNRVGIIKESIQKYGYISNPIICNEKMEVIDGQGRLQACTELGLPIEYRVVGGIGINECLAMNLKPTSWTPMDYCISYAERGDENYKRLVDLARTTKFSPTLIYSIVRGGSNMCGRRSEQLRNGDFVLGEYDYLKIKDILSKLNTLRDVSKEIGGRTDSFYTATAWAMQLPNVDADRLLKVIRERANMIHPIANGKAYLTDLTKAYNKGLSKGKVYFEIEVERNAK